MRSATSFLLFTTLATAAFGQQSFDSPKDAAEALIAAADRHDAAELSKIFGSEGKGILTSGDKTQDQAEQSEFVRLARAKYDLVADGRNPNRMILSIGDMDWPFPAPLVRSNGKWSFDAVSGSVEMEARRIGGNELDAIEACAGFVAAERQQAMEGHEYALRFSANPNFPDDLQSALWEGQKKPAKPFNGYYFRVLQGQGPSAPGGTHTYLFKNRLVGGAGLVAWPAQYGVTGIQTFIVNQDGVIYEKDIPPASGAVGTPVTAYDPDPSWNPVD
jgi:hypothetical protein